jgi:hypothetical protein
MAGAMTNNVDGKLYTRNPVTSGPQGYAWNMGFKTITAVSKSGHTTKSISASKNAGSYDDSVETDWLIGPTYTSAGTKFTSFHSGYNTDGVYQTKYASKSY